MLSAPVSGLMGLAFENIATSGATPMWQTLAQTPGILDEPLMSFQLTRYVDDHTVRSSEPGGTFTIGSLNQSLYSGEIDYQPVPDALVGYWTIELSCMSLLSRLNHFVDLVPKL